jgi:hypothetical protein
MKSFRGYIKEAAPAWTESLSTMLFDLPRAGIVDLVIPLSPSIFKRVWPETIRSTAFHLTDLDGIRKLKRMQGGKRSISAFYNMMHTEFSYGIKSEGGYIVEMEADVLIAMPDDIGSQPDKTGRRWMALDTIKHLGKVDISYPMKALLVELMVKWEEHINEFVEVSMNDRVIGQFWSKFGRNLAKNKKDLSLVIRDYMDGVEKVIKKHSQTLRSAFTNYVKDRELKPDPDSGERELWDELVVNNFKIKKIHVASEYGEDFQDDDDIEGFPHQVWPDDRDLGDYIARTVQRGK